METTTTRCECGNAATETLENGTPACEWCAEHDGHTAPANVYTMHTIIGGEYVAKCNGCDYVCAYWDCPCELAHACEPLTVDLLAGDDDAMRGAFLAEQYHGGQFTALYALASSGSLELFPGDGLDRLRGELRDAIEIAGDDADDLAALLAAVDKLGGAR
jgi:hypothetical protein